MTPKVCPPSYANSVAKSNVELSTSSSDDNADDADGDGVKTMRICNCARGMRSINLHGVFFVTSDELVRLSSLRWHGAAAKTSEQAQREALAYRHAPRPV